MLMQKMMTVTSEVLSQMFFLVPDDDDIPFEEEETEKTYIEITHNGALEYVILYDVARSLAEEMASNFLGVDANEITDELVSSTLQEVCNMLVGNFLKAVSDLDATMQLGLPQVDLTPEQQEFVTNNKSYEGSVNFDARRFGVVIYHR